MEGSGRENELERGREGGRGAAHDFARKSEGVRLSVRQWERE
jgi:hypothetical protein